MMHARSSKGGIILEHINSTDPHCGKNAYGHAEQPMDKPKSSKKINFGKRAHHGRQIRHLGQQRSFEGLLVGFRNWLGGYNFGCGTVLRHALPLFAPGEKSRRGTRPRRCERRQGELDEEVVKVNTPARAAQHLRFLSMRSSRRELAVYGAVCRHG